MASIKITRNGQTVECHGTFDPENNVYAVFDDEWFDGAYCIEALEQNWIEVVETLTGFAILRETELIELTVI